MLQRNAVLNTPALQSSPYIQPLPADSEYDSKISPLAMLTRACNKIESSMMNSNGSQPSAPSSQKGSKKIPSSLPREYSETIQRSKLTIHSPHSSHSNKSCSPPLKSSGSTTSTKPSTSPLTSQGINSPLNEKVTPKKSAIDHESSSPKSSYSLPSSTSVASALPSVIPPNSVSAYASLTSPPTSQNMSMIAELAARNPCTDPLCRDPTCPTNVMRNAQQYASLMAAAGSSRHPSYLYPTGIPSLASTGMPPLVPNPNQDSQPPFICNWMSGGDFCGKRFPSGEELMSHLRLHTSSSTASSSGTSTAPKSTSPTSTDPSLSALQAAQIQALYPHLSPSAGNSGTSALAALQLQAARASSLNKTPSSQTLTSSSPSLPTQSPRSSMDPGFAYAMDMASAVQAAQASASAQAAASSRYHPYGRSSAPILPPSLMGGLGATAPPFPSGLPFPSPYLPSSYPPFLQTPYGLPML